jgi:hypothetical protein
VAIQPPRDRQHGETHGIVACVHNGRRGFVSAGFDGPTAQERHVG